MGISQKKLTGKIDIPQSTYSDYENGMVRTPMEIFIRLARLYDVDMNYISGVSNKRNPFPKE